MPLVAPSVCDCRNPAIEWQFTPRFESVGANADGWLVARLVRRMALFGGLAVLMCTAVPSAQARVRCVRHGDAIVGVSRHLVVVSHDNSPNAAPGARYLVCRRASGRRRTLATSGGGVGKAPFHGVGPVKLRGRFVYAVLTSDQWTGERSSLLLRVDTRTWRRDTQSLQLHDHVDNHPITKVTALVAAPRGRAVVRVKNDFAAGIIVAGHHEANYIDEGLVTNIGRPRVDGDTVSWRHGSANRSSPVLLTDRCPEAPPDVSIDHPVLATGDAVTQDSWFCERATGTTGHLDGNVVRLRGPLAVVQRPSDVRVVDLSSRQTIVGPIPSQSTYRPTVGSSGTLVFRRRNADGNHDDLIAVPAGKPARTIATGRISDVRYEDGVLRYYLNSGTGQQVTQLIP